MACAGIILGDAYADYEMILRNIDAASAAALEALRRLKPDESHGETGCAPGVFAGVLSEVVQPIPDGEALIYIEKAAVADEACFAAVHAELKRIRRYALLGKLFEARARHASQKGQYLFSAGVYAMMGNEPGRASEHFANAMRSGFYSDEMEQYMRISGDGAVL
jgi:hypothetical protein